MAKIKYYYDSETLSYRRVERKKGKTITLALLVMCAIILILVAGAVISPYLVESPKEKALKPCSSMKKQCLKIVISISHWENL